MSLAAFIPIKSTDYWKLAFNVKVKPLQDPVEPSLLYTIHVSSGCQNTVNGYALSLNLLGIIS